MKTMQLSIIWLLFVFLFFSLNACKSTDKKTTEKKSFQSETPVGKDPAKLGKYKEQIELLKQRINADPRDVNAFAQLGYLYGQWGDIREEINYYEKAIAIYPQFKEVHYNLACAYADLGEKEKALQALERALINGFRSQSLIVSDKDLRALHDDERFKALLKKFFGEKRDTTKP